MNYSRRRPPAEAEAAARSETRLRVERAVNQASGQLPLHYLRVRETLLGYLSPILVDSVLDKAMRARHLTPSSLSPSALLEITSDIMVGLRLFVAAERLPQVMLELADILDMDQT